MKRLEVVVAIILLLALVYFRGYAPSAGVATGSADYGNHISISEHLKSFDLFPELSKTHQGIHSVSKYLPIYHGLVGFHVLALVFESLGMPRPGSYGILLDLSLLVIVFVFLSLLREKLRNGWRWEYLIAILFLFPIYFTYFAEAANYSFYAQLLSQALIVGAFYLWRKGWAKTAVAFLVYAVFTYPDFTIWLIPPVLFVMTTKPWKYLRVPLALFWLAMAATPFPRAHLPGPDIPTLYCLLIVTVLLAAYAKDLLAKQKGFFWIAVCHVAYCILFLLVTTKDMTFSYYAMKFAAFSFLLVPYFFLSVPVLSSAKGRLVTACLLAFLPFQAQLWTAQVPAYFQPTKYVDNKTYAQAQQVRAQAPCASANTYFTMDESLTDVDQSKSRTIVRNAMLMNYDIYSFDMTQPDLNVELTPKSPFGPMTTFLRMTNSEVAALIEKTTLKSELCLIVPNDFADKYSGSTKLELLKQANGFTIFKSSRTR